jgi:predicted MFS family arabinose efflux permease
LNTAWGWEWNFIMLGCASAIISVIGLTFFVRTPPGAVVQADAQGGKGRTARETYFGNLEFWLIAGAILAASIATFGGMASLVGVLTARGFEQGLIADVISFAAISSLLGRILVGYLLDKVHAPRLSAFVFAMAATGFAILLWSPGAASAFVGAAFIAIAIGSEADILTYLISRYFPLVEFSRVVAVIWVCWAWGGGGGTSLVSASLSQGWGYEPPFMLFSLLLLGAVSMLFALGPYRYAKAD